MKALFAILAISMAGCSSYLRSSRNIDCRIAYHYAARDQIAVDVTVTNHADGKVTLVEDPNFYTISIRARDRRLVEGGMKMIIDYYPAPLSSLRTIPAGGSFTFRETFGYRRVSPRSVEVYDGTISPDVPHFRVRDSKLVASFSYGFYPDYFPWAGRVLRPRILTTELDAEMTIDTK